MKVITSIAAAAFVGFGALGVTMANAQQDPMMQPGMQGDMMGKTVLQTAMENKDFSKLVMLIKYSGLDETLDVKGPITVFAPTNEAFMVFEQNMGGMTDISYDTFTSSFFRNNPLPSPGKVSYLLKYHVVPGRWDAARISEAITAGGGTATLTTASGDKLMAMVEGSDVMLKDAAGNTIKVTATDVNASNGVIHVVERVLMPMK